MSKLLSGTYAMGIICEKKNPKTVIIFSADEKMTALKRSHETSPITNDLQETILKYLNYCQKLRNDNHDKNFFA